jgi:hypothetical protein
MQTYHVETHVTREGAVTITGLPFRPGDEVEVTVRLQPTEANDDKRYPLRGTLTKYLNPFESVAEDDWEAMK